MQGENNQFLKTEKSIPHQIFVFQFVGFWENPGAALVYHLWVFGSVCIVGGLSSYSLGAFKFFVVGAVPRLIGMLGGYMSFCTWPMFPFGIFLIYYTINKYMLYISGLQVSIHIFVSLILVVIERQGRIVVVAKATGESSESSTSLSIVESVQNIVSPLSIYLSPISLFLY